MSVGAYIRLDLQAALYHMEICPKDVRLYVLQCLLHNHTEHSISIYAYCVPWLCTDNKCYVVYQTLKEIC